METAIESSAAQKISSLLATLDKNSMRYKILETAYQFKTNWIALGEHLHTIYKSQEYKQWGFPTFEKYCTQEIGIRKATAEKLTTSYYFLKNHSPQKLEQSDKHRIPDLDVVNVLAKAKTDERLTEDQFSELETSAYEENCSNRILTKQYNDFIKEYDDTHIPDEDASSEEELNKRTISLILNLFEKIDRKLNETHGIPLDIQTDFRKILVRLKSLSS
ncbi:hypothetical protein KDK77_09490 [bacterium]|nr:hypothetical protein [bacterium]MCP5462945.1 hypothetical protein [bacterium]